MLRLLVAFALAFVSLAASAVVNLNTATKEELVALSGIGPTKAQAILDYRAQHGGFKSVEELKDVKGIGARRYERLKADVTVTPVQKSSSSSSRGDTRPQAIATKVDAKPAK